MKHINLKQTAGDKIIILDKMDFKVKVIFMNNVISTWYFLLEYNCFTRLYSFLLYSNVNQLNVYIHISLPLWTCLPPHLPSHPSRSSQNTELSSRCYTAAPHQLSVLHLVVYICQWYSLDLSHISFPYCVHMLTLYCISIYTLQIGSSGPSF